MKFFPQHNCNDFIRVSSEVSERQGTHPKPVSRSLWIHYSRQQAFPPNSHLNVRPSNLISRRFVLSRFVNVSRDEFKIPSATKSHRKQMRLGRATHSSDGQEKVHFNIAPQLGQLNESSHEQQQHKNQGFAVRLGIFFLLFNCFVGFFFGQVLLQLFFFSPPFPYELSFNSALCWAM